MSFIDLHTHSTASDGTTDPADLPHLAQKAGLAAIALTDHDTIAGHDACAAACEQVGIDFVPGIELSCDRGQPRGAMHILGYFIEPNTPDLHEVIERLWAARSERAPQVVERLNAIGLDITMEQIEAMAGCAMIGRPHIASVLVERGYAASVTDAFGRYLGFGQPAYVRKDNLPTDVAITAIHAAGGLAVLAHPSQLKCADDAELQQVIGQLRGQGLDGIEVMHSDHSPKLVAQYQRLAKQLGMQITGGSDFHGSRKEIELGSQHVPAAWLDTLRGALSQ